VSNSNPRVYLRIVFYVNRNLGHNAEHHLPLPPLDPQTFNTNASEDYMARSRRSPLMRDQWRAEEDAYDRHPHRYRESDRSDRRPRTPPPTRRDDRDEHYRSREPIAVESYRPTSSREIERQSRKSQARTASPSPRRHSKSKPSIQKSRPLEERITRPRDASPAKSTKRKRTRSPSPARSDRYVPSRRRSHSRERSDFRDRRGQGTDRAFSPRRLSPNRNPRLDRRSEAAPSDSYFSSRYRRDESRSSRTRAQRRPRSPRRHSRSPPPHRTYHYMYIYIYNIFSKIK
jgi:CTD kinase subunit alpha